MKGDIITKTMRKAIIVSILILSLFVFYQVSEAQETPNPIVHAVLFYSTSCGHCEYVITQVLPPLFEQYGDQLIIIGIDIGSTTGRTLFLNTIQYFKLQSGGVPLLAIGNTYLIGSVDIPEKLPGLIEQYMAQGGVDWPIIPGLAEVLAASLTAPTPTVETPTQALPTANAATPSPLSPTPTSSAGGMIIPANNNLDIGGRLARDLEGNILAIIVLVGMLVTLYFVISVFQQAVKRRPNDALSWPIPLLCIVGLIVAGYLAFVEVKHVEAFCGLVGDCNTVQQSDYARMFGVLPIGVLGVIGYIMILLAWSVGRSSNKRNAAYAKLALFGMTAFGVIFSIYLTFLEPFVIGATCAWCLTSAIIMTALLWMSTHPGKAAIDYIFHGDKYAKPRKSYRSSFKSDGPRTASQPDRLKNGAQCDSTQQRGGSDHRIDDP